MRTFLRSKLTLLFMSLGMLLAVPAIAFADNIQDDVQDNVSSALQLTAGDANSDKTAEIRVVGNNAQQDPDPGCNFDTASESLTIKFDTPAGVTATALDGATANAGEMKFTTCGVDQTVKLSASSSAAAGDYSVTAHVVDNATNGTFNSQVLIPIKVSAPVKQNQTISFDSGTPTSKTFGDADFNVSATASSGLPVSYSAKTGSSCTVSSAGLVHLTGAGTCTVVASQGGNSTYNAAPNVEHAITVGKATPTITWSDPSAIVYGTALGSTQLNATAQGVGGGSLAGGFAYTPDSGAVLDAGTQTLSTIFTPTNTTDYTTANKSVSLTVNPKPITGNFTADNKVYDGNTNAPVLTRSLNGVVGNDVVTLNGGTATFDTKNVGNGKTVTLTGATLGGADAGNYSLSSVSTTTANITAKELTGSFTASNKVYDGGTSANVASTSLPGVISPDAVNLDVTNAQFDTKNVGTGKTVTADLALSGAQAGNYSLSSNTASTTANITAKGLTISGLSAQDKYYDGNTNAQITGTPSLVGVISPDAVSLSGTATGTFDNASVGTGKTVTVSGLSLSGADAGNYSVTMPTLSAAIKSWTTGGFYQPVDMNVWNTVKAGSTVPMKFELFAGATELKDVSAIKSYTHKQVSCGALDSSAEDSVEMTTTGSTSLRFDSTSDQFIFNWKSQSTWKAGTCYVVTVVGQDGTPLNAYFKMK